MNSSPALRDGEKPTPSRPTIEAGKTHSKKMRLNRRAILFFHMSFVESNGGNHPRKGGRLASQRSRLQPRAVKSQARMSEPSVEIDGGFRLDKLARCFRNSPDMKPNIPRFPNHICTRCFALVQNTQAVSPPPDGGYPGGNTAEGQNALLSLTSGTYNTAVGIYSLLSLTDGEFCTGVGAGTLLANTADQNTATGAGALLSNTPASSTRPMERSLSLAIPLAPHEGNTASGASALFNSISGCCNNAVGFQALLENTEGFNNVANGNGLRATTLASKHGHR